MENSANLTMGLAALGLAVGIYYAYQKDMKFWGYVGFALLGNITGMAVGQIASSI